jgi:hypothetical protein
MATNKIVDKPMLQYFLGKVKSLIDLKVDKVTGKGLSSNDYTTEEKNKLAGVATGATHVEIDTTLATTGKAADAKATGDALATKVDKVNGKGLSTNDYTIAEKTKLAGIQEGAAAVDSTLSVTGKAADAKATGDEITNLKQDINELEEGKMDVVTVSGSTVTQTGVANKFYVCGTVATLTFTAPSSGICGIRFTSGSTPTVLTVSGVSYWMNGFDPASLEASKTYEISILNGVGVVGC